MAKIGSSTPSASRHGAYRVVGEARDGVKILAPKTKPTHFTAKEIRSTIAKVRQGMAGSVLSQRSAKKK
jgi:hypothetical protein